MINPNKYITKAVIDAVSPLACYTNIVPKAVTIPKQYAIVTSVGKQETAVSKTCYEWEVSFNLDVYVRGDHGTDSSFIVDDLIEKIIPKIKHLTTPVIRVKNVKLEFERDLSFQSTVGSINRKVLNYTVWCDYQEK